jgi:hypothetical protein
VSRHPFVDIVIFKARPEALLRNRSQEMECVTGLLAFLELLSEIVDPVDAIAG